MLPSLHKIHGPKIWSTPLSQDNWTASTYHVAAGTPCVSASIVLIPIPQPNVTTVRQKNRNVYVTIDSLFHLLSICIVHSQECRGARNFPQVLGLSFAGLIVILESLLLKDLAIGNQTMNNNITSQLYVQYPCLIHTSSHFWWSSLARRMVQVTRWKL